MYSGRRAPWIETLRLESGNLQAALSWGLDNAGDKEVALRLSGALGRFWYYTGNLNEGRQWLVKAIAAGVKGEPSLALARVFYSAAKLAWVQGDFANAPSFGEESVSIAAAGTEELFLAESLTLLGYTLVSAGNHKDALPAFERSLEIERRLGAKWQIAFTLAMSSEALRLDGRTEDAGAALSEALTLFRALEDPWGRGVAYAMSSGLQGDLGDFEEMDRLLDLTEAAFNELSEEKYVQARLGIMRGYVYLRLGRTAAAAERFRDGLKFAQQLGQTAYILVALAGVAAIAAVRGDAGNAALLFSYASPLLDSGAIYVDDGAVMARATYVRSLAVVRDQLTESEFARWSREGRSISTEEAIRVAGQVLAAATPA
jgi:tetratricopeptide (TPR) repeat protein